MKLSLACMVAISLLVFSEVNSFLAVKSQNFMVVDTPRGLQRLQVNLNVTVPHVPCHVLTLDCVDAMVKLYRTSPCNHYKENSQFSI